MEKTDVFKNKEVSAEHQKYIDALMELKPNSIENVYGSDSAYAQNLSIANYIATRFKLCTTEAIVVLGEYYDQLDAKASNKKVNSSIDSESKEKLKTQPQDSELIQDICNNYDNYNKPEQLKEVLDGISKLVDNVGKRVEQNTKLK